MRLNKNDNKVWVKVCGICDVENARIACEEGVDAIGLVFAPSRRLLSLEKAEEVSKSIMAWPHVKKVGVFVNPSHDEVRKAFEACGLDLAQLHGDEPPEFCKTLQYPYIRAFPARSEAWLLEQVSAYPKEAIIVDSFSQSERGGSGKVFPWSIARTVSSLGYQVVLAGGLHCDNVHQAVMQSGAVGVDVSSGVETNGQKDPDKIRRFIKSVKDI